MPTVRACVGCGAAHLLPQGRSIWIPFPAFDGLAMAIAIAAVVNISFNKADIGKAPSLQISGGETVPDRYLNGKGNCADAVHKN